MSAKGAGLAAAQAAALDALDGSGLRVGIARSRFNAAIGDAMLASCRARLAALGVAASDITVVEVPGALEAPFALSRLAATGRFDALIALGAVIRGETYHFELVSNESAAGLTRVSLDHGLPVANGILTTENDAQARERAVPKGRDCADVAVEMALLARRLSAAASGAAK